MPTWAVSWHVPPYLESVPGLDVEQDRALAAVELPVQATNRGQGWRYLGTHRRLRGSLALAGGRDAGHFGASDESHRTFQANDLFFGIRPTDDEVASIGHNPTADRGDDRYDPNDPMLPVAWIKSYQVPGGKQGKVFATTMGASTDLLSQGTLRMLVQGVYWCLGQEKQIPESGAKVDLVGEYRPTTFKFEPRNHWKNQRIKPAAFKMN